MGAVQKEERRLVPGMMKRTQEEKKEKRKITHPVMNYSNKQRMDMPLFSYDAPPPFPLSPSSLLCHSYLAKNIA